MLRHIRSALSWIQVLTADAILIALAWSAAFFIRFDGHVPSHEVRILLHLLPVLLGLRLLSLLVSRAYSSSWRYITLHDATHLLGGIIIGTALFGSVIFLWGISGFPRSILILEGLLALLALSGVRLSYRIIQEVLQTRFHVPDGQRRLLIVGVGPTGEGLIRQFHRQRTSRYHPVGFVDDDSGMQGKEILGVRVHGTVADLSRVIEQESVQEVIIALSEEPRDLTSIVDRCLNAGIRPKIAPPLEEVLRGDGRFPRIREIEMADLLHREPVRLDTEEIAAYLRDKVVLVTGAAGSIGSELCRQIVEYGTKGLVLLDRWENGLYFLDLELQEKRFVGSILPVVGDITDRAKVERLLEQVRPHVVFHAAAYKHVPLMEVFPEEAIKNNVGGTFHLATLASTYGVEQFVMISTDKAVQPTSIMGASKRICERLVQVLSTEGETRFITTRFGNVLGSEGSVVPLFKRQIERGGPVRITHPDITRYFMSIPEAVQLVLQASILGEGGEIFVLDMGREMKIVDLAERLIRLSGLEPEVEIPIQFIGLRPGEKMYERLWAEGEVPKPTAHEHILVADSHPGEPETIYPLVEHLLRAAEQGDRIRLMEMIRALVPEYQPDLHRGLYPPSK